MSVAESKVAGGDLCYHGHFSLFTHSLFSFSLLVHLQVREGLIRQAQTAIKWLL